jgi:lipopolysaccharide/colanic/teichoic acid biosynthesis glycosyltransferase
MEKGRKNLFFISYSPSTRQWRGGRGVRLRLSQRGYKGYNKMTILQKSAKRMFDIVFSLLGMVILSPLIVIIALFVKISSRGPILYSAPRIGQYGKPFPCHKFRSMYTGADRFGSVTTGIDKRITPVGRILRKYKLDELSQLWNVFSGTMSFVGPRPDVSGYADKLTGDDRIILSVRPGITGPASLRFRNEEELLAKVDNPLLYNDEVLWPSKVKINREYVEQYSFIKDIGYILATVFGTGSKTL